MNKKSDYLKHLNLSPTSDAENIEEYSENLKYALDEKDILNIAISGPYGSGKSSFIKTFFKNNNQYNPIYISLGEFETGKVITYSNLRNVEKAAKRDDSNEKTIEKNGEEKGDLEEETIKDIEYYRSIEKSIIQQLLYQVDEDKVPLSRFKRINAYSKSKLFLSCIFALICITLLAYIFFPIVSHTFFENFIKIVTLISTIFNIHTKNNICVMIILTMLFLSFCFFKVVEYFKNNISSINRFKIQDIEIEIKDDYESIFNKYLDEIVYFFQSTGFRIVIIEDLDRFTGAPIIIQKLKELNQLINSSSKINHPVKFIFSIKDDFFTDSRERTKFFDKIIPIIPVSSFSYSNEIIWEKLGKVYEFTSKNKFGKIDKDFINNVAIYIDDMRIINNIILEFTIYNDKLKEKGLDERKLFTMIMYKNLYPSKYSELLIDKGTIYNVFYNKNSKISKIIETLEIDIKKIKSQKETLEKEKLNNINELKRLLVSYLLEYDKNKSYNRYEYKEIYFIIKGANILISDFLKDDFDLKKMEDNTIIFVDYNQYYNLQKKEEDKIFEYFGGKTNFFERVNMLKEDSNKIISELQQKIESKNNEIRVIKELPLKELILKYGIEKFIDEKWNVNEFEKAMLIKGYITSDYHHYITMYNGNYDYNDIIFVQSVKRQEKLKCTYNLKNVKDIVSQLDLMDFSYVSILNINLIDYLFNNIKKYGIKLNRVIDLFSEIDDDKFEFIYEYENLGNFFEQFADLIINSSNNLWTYLYHNKSNNFDYIDKWVFRYLKQDIGYTKVDEDFKKYLDNKEDLFNIPADKLEICINNLKSLKIKFKRLNKVDDKIFKSIYKNNLYELNIQMVTKILKDLFNINYDDISDKLLTEIFENENLNLLKERVQENLIEFLENCYFNIEKHNNSEKTFIYLLNSDISLESKFSIIEREFVKVTEITQIKDLEVYSKLLNLNKVQNNLENLLFLYNINGEISDELVNMINSNEINFEKIKDYDEERLGIFESDFIINNEIDIDIYKKVISNFNIVLENFNTNNLEDSKVEYLIDNKIIVFNKNNNDFLKINYNNLYYKFLNNNKDELKQKIEEFGITDKEILYSPNIDKDIKDFLITEKAEYFTPLPQDLYNLILKDYITINDNINEKVLSSKDIDDYEKIKYLNKIKESINISNFPKYFKKLGYKYKYIGSIPGGRTEINNTPETLELIDYIVKKGIVSSRSIEKNGTKIRVNNFRMESNLIK